jgi:ABC-type multidrug transport system fused ATPase/permease subunit
MLNQNRKMSRIGLMILPVFVLSAHAESERTHTTAKPRLVRQTTKEERLERSFDELERLMENYSRARQESLSSETTRKAIQLERARNARNALATFERARQDLGRALDANASRKDSARNMVKSTAVLLDFIKETTRKSPRFDSTELRTLTLTELGREAVTSAERVSSQLAAFVQAEEGNIVDLAFLLSLPKLQEELQRLQWIAEKLG